MLMRSFEFQLLRQKSPLRISRRWLRARAFPIATAVMLLMLVILGGESYSFVYFVF